MEIPINFLFGYLVFIFFIFFITTYGGVQIIENLPPPPSFPTTIGSLSDLWALVTFPFQILIYFYQFIFITSVNYPFMSVLLVPAGIILALFIALFLIRLVEAIGSILPFT